MRAIVHLNIVEPSEHTELRFFHTYVAFQSRPTQPYDYLEYLLSFLKKTQFSFVKSDFDF